MRSRKLKINSGTAEHYTQSITLGYKMSYDTNNGGLVPLNVLPKKLNSANLKMWQRSAAAAARPPGCNQRCGSPGACGGQCKKLKRPDGEGSAVTHRYSNLSPCGNRASGRAFSRRSQRLRMSVRFAGGRIQTICCLYPCRTRSSLVCLSDTCLRGLSAIWSPLH